MSRGLLLSTIFYAASIGALVTLVNPEVRAVSLRIWLAGFVVWFALVSLVRLTKTFPLAPDTRRGFRWRLRGRKKVAPKTSLRQVRALDALVLRSCKNERAFSQQLRPRLVALADHGLAVNHGIDRSLAPARAQAVLGELSWLLDSNEIARRPTLEELDRFIDVLETQPDGQAETTT